MQPNLRFARLEQREGNLRHKAIGGTRFKPVEPFERKGCKQIEQRHGLNGQRDVVIDLGRDLYAGEISTS
jgi:hypothetical protein